MTPTAPLPLLVALAAFLVPPRAAPPAAPPAVADDARVEAVRETLASGDAVAALDMASVALEVQPESWRLLEVASEAALAAERADEALHYARLALTEIPADDRKLRRDREALASRLVELDPLAERRQAVIDEFAESVYRLAEFARQRKFFANAVDIYLRCADSDYEERAQRALVRLYENEKSVAALIESGIDVPVETEEDRKDPEWIAREDADHASMDDPHEAESDLYTIESNAGYVLTQQVLRGMEQMNVFLREMFDYKTRGGGMRRAYVTVHASQKQFMELEEGYGNRPNVGGFFSPSENRISTFDSRPQGEPLSELWRTLFHEGSHQFVMAISSNLTPAWFNEGTACYFEGTRVLPNGKVEANLIPENRLRALVASLDQQRVDLEEVIGFFKQGSYSGEFYPYGWGLVYFIRNYEDESGERVYLPYFNEYVLTYRTGGNHDVLDRWVEYFVREPEREGIETFEDWMVMWEAWIRDLHEIHFGDASQADKLIDKGRRQLALGFPDHAVETFRWATRKRPGDPAATYGLAEALSLLEREDAAIYYYRQAAAWADAQPEPDASVPGFTDTTADEFAERCRERIGEIYSKMIEGMGEARDEFVGAVEELSDEYVAAGLPRAALALLADAEHAVGPLRELHALRAEVQGESPIEIRRRRRLDLSDGLAAWSGSTDEFTVQGDNMVVGESPGLRMALYDEELPDSFRFEATLEMTNEGRGPAAVGLVFGANLGGQQLVGWMDSGRIVRVRFEPVDFGTRPVIAGSLKDGFLPEEGFRLAIEVRPTDVEVFVDGESLGRVPFAREELDGGVGLWLQNARAEFREPRLYY